jgi:recombination protein RecR
MLRISSLEKLIHELGRLPGIGPKTAARLAYHVLRTPDLSGNLQSALALVQESVHLCPQCHSFTDAIDLCHFCTDPLRRNDLLCVVEEPMDIARVESSGAFRGRYHVLHGAIAPLDDVGPDDLKIAELFDRIRKQAESGQPVEEVILALDPDLEGDTTALFLSQRLREMGLKVSRIASGVPIGSDIDYVDDRTLSRALENRVEI